MTEMVVFEEFDTKLRAILIEDKPWFLAKDVCVALDIVNVSQSLTTLDEDEKQAVNTICSTYSIRGPY